MNDYTMILLFALLGQVMPQVTDLANKHIPSSKVRFWLSMVVCFVISLAFNFNRLSLGSPDAFIMDALILWGSGQSAYKMFYDGSKQQSAIRFSASPLPIKELVPDVKSLIAKLPVPSK